MSDTVDFPSATEKANLSLDTFVNTALEHVATRLKVSKSAYVEALLRVKFGFDCEDALSRYIRDVEGISIPADLKTFDPKAVKKESGPRRPGPKPRIQKSTTMIHGDGINVTGNGNKVTGSKVTKKTTSK